MTTEVSAPSVEFVSCPSFAARSFLPTDPGYESARRVWNAMIDRRPLLIAVCAGAADVIATVNFAARAACRWPFAAGGTALPATARATAAWCLTARA